MTEVNLQLDARGLLCPVPVLRTRKAINQLASGEVLELLSSDPGSGSDARAFCEQTGNQFLGSEDRDGHWAIRIRKG